MSDQYRVEVQIKGGDDVHSPWLSEDDAKSALGEIKKALSGSIQEAALGVPDVDWMTAQGQNIKAASLKKRPTAASFSLS